jgi:hypothetical protein
MMQMGCKTAGIDGLQRRRRKRIRERKEKIFKKEGI